ncbi:hypothetical protein ACFWUQ_06575 [Streptomyces sp. NPDC058662]|uniref:hypothetical protein n=1 Tax=Streptomyces sp. NPDC058662 TaxID=3346583 RepID=UPI0036667573
MADQDKTRSNPRTTPSEAEGESGDREARRQAEDAVVGRSGTTRNDQDTQGHSAERRPRPGPRDQTRENRPSEDQSGDD